MKKYIILLISSLVSLAIANAQKLDGMYAGAQLYSTPFNGMQIDNITIYFRPDGTFTDKLDAADWKTKVSGRYIIKNNTVQFTIDKDTKTYKLSTNGNLESTAGIKHTLHKLKQVSVIPAGAFESKTAGSSGGMGTGMPNVAAFSSSYLYFDGKGNFSADREGVVGIGGDVTGGTIGGKVNTRDKAKRGTYKLSPGQITLTLADGSVTKHSFLYSPPNEEDMVMLDGTFYFRMENEKPAPVTRSNTAAKQPVTEKAASTASLPSVAILLNKLREASGGANIDKLVTVKESATITGNLQAITLTDIAQKKLRVEIRQNGRLLMVRQLDATGGWQWANNKKQPLSQNDKTEMVLSLYQGIIGLHKNLNQYLLTGSVSQSGSDYMLTFLVNDKKVVYMLDANYKIKANAYALGPNPNYSVYTNFATKSGITYPSVVQSSDGKNTINITTTAIEFNPALKDADWGTPQAD